MNSRQRERLQAEDEKNLQRNYVFLKRELDGKDLVDMMFQENIFSMDDIEEVTNAVPNTRENRTEIFLRKLFASGPGGYSVFLTALEKDGYSHVVDKLEAPTLASEDEEPHYRRTITGTLGDGITRLRMEDAIQTFIETDSFRDVKRKLEQCGHVTICGASGEGKTTMSLMVAREYMEKGYQVVFVDKIDDFDLNVCVKTTSKLFLILDDIFGTVGLSTDVTHLRNMLNSLLVVLRQCKKVGTKAVNAEHGKQVQLNVVEIIDIRIVFSSKSYNFEAGMTALQYERLEFFSSHSVVDLTTNKSYRYSKTEKCQIFEKYRKMYGTVNSVQIEHIIDVSDTLFGFPMTCRLYFDLPSFTEKAEDFFARPLLYLREELQSMLSKKQNQAAALTLILLCENKLNLCDLELPNRNPLIDGRFKLLTNIFPSVTRAEICTAAKQFRETLFSDGGVVQFAHSSIHDACACALFKFHPAFVLEYCSEDLLYERLKAGKPDEAKSTDNLDYIIVSEMYFDIVASRLSKSIQQGNFAKTITHPILNNTEIIKVLLQKLQTESSNSSEEKHWIHKKDKGKGFLYWAVQGHSSGLLNEIENVFKVKFSQSEILEALDASVEKDNLTLLILFMPRIEQKCHPTITGKLLLLSAEHGRRETTRYLLQVGADVNTRDDNKQNFVHIACYFGHVQILTALMSQRKAWVEHFRKQLFNSVDITGRTPAMMAALTGSKECFELVFGETNNDINTNYGNNVIHDACFGGNISIINHCISSTNINNKGMHGWTPVMVAVVEGHKDVFDYLVTKGADQTLVDDYDDSLLHLACQGGNTDIVQQLVSSANIDICGQHRWTPAMKTVVHGHLNVFDCIVSKKADLTLMDTNGDTILHLACRGGNASIVQKLVSPDNINSKGMHFMTPAMKAAYNGHREVLELLIENKADLKLVDKHGIGIVNIAKEGGHTHIVEFLESAVKG